MNFINFYKSTECFIVFHHFNLRSNFNFKRLSNKIVKTDFKICLMCNNDNNYLHNVITNFQLSSLIIENKNFKNY